MWKHVSMLPVVLLAAATASGQSVAVTACGQTIATGESGVVESDLTCPGGEGTFVVAVENGASLDLAGHALTGARTGIRCTKRCTITSTGAPGTVRDSEVAGIAAVSEGGRLTLSNLALENHALALLTDAERGKVFGTDLTLTDNGLAMQARKIRVTGLVADGNFVLAQARKTILADAVVTASGDSAIKGRVAVLVDSSVTGSTSGIDLLTQRRPRVVNSTCGASRKLQDPSETWGVCAGD